MTMVSTFDASKSLSLLLVEPPPQPLTDKATFGIPRLVNVHRFTCTRFSDWPSY